MITDRQNLTMISPQNPLVRLYNAVSTSIWPVEKKPWYPFLKKLAESGRPIKELVAAVISLTIGSSVNFAQSMYESYSCCHPISLNDLCLPKL